MSYKILIEEKHSQKMQEIVVFAFLKLIYFWIIGNFAYVYILYRFSVTRRQILTICMSDKTAIARHDYAKNHKCLY